MENQIARSNIKERKSVLLLFVQEKVHRNGYFKPKSNLSFRGIRETFKLGKNTIDWVILPNHLHDSTCNNLLVVALGWEGYIGEILKMAIFQDK